MEVIKLQDENISKAWGIQKPQEVEYRLINYLVKKEVDNKTLLLNTVTGELVLLNSDEVNAIKETPVRYSSVLDDMITHHFLVPVDYDEHKVAIKLRTSLKWLDNLKPKYINYYTILPTTACNARCFYCFEAGCKAYTMSKETADKTVNFIKEHHGGKKVFLDWFGGEPTLCDKTIDYISSSLKDLNIEFTSQMTSNGYLFNSDMADRAKDLWNLTKIQITLDGTEEVYNKVKSYVGVNGSPFKRVMDNIGILLERDIRISVRLNLGIHNYEDLFDLLNQLFERYGDNKNLGVYVVPINDGYGFNPHKNSQTEKEILNKNRVALEDYIKKYDSFPYRNGVLPKLKANACLADSDYTVLIGPTGNIGKCADLFAEDLGDLDNGIKKEELEKWKESFELPQCKTCFKFPECIRLNKCPESDKCYKSNVESSLREYSLLLDSIYYDYLNKGDSTNE